MKKISDICCLQHPQTRSEIGGGVGSERQFGPVRVQHVARQAN